METQRHSPTLQDTWAVRQRWQVLNQPPGEQKLYGGENERSNYYVWSGEDNLPELPHLLTSCVSCWLVTFFFHILSIHLAKTLDLLCVCVYISSLAVNNSVHYHYMSSSSRRAGFFFFLYSNSVTPKTVIFVITPECMVSIFFESPVYSLSLFFLFWNPVQCSKSRPGLSQW